MVEWLTRMHKSNIKRCFMKLYNMGDGETLSMRSVRSFSFRNWNLKYIKKINVLELNETKRLKFYGVSPEICLKLGVSLISLNFIENRNAVSINTISLSMFHSLCFVSYRFFFFQKIYPMICIPFLWGFLSKKEVTQQEQMQILFLSTGITVDFRRKTIQKQSEICKSCPDNNTKNKTLATKNGCVYHFGTFFDV